MLPRLLKAPAPVVNGAPVHHRAETRCGIVPFPMRHGKPFFLKMLAVAHFFHHYSPVAGRGAFVPPISSTISPLGGRAANSAASSAAVPR